MLPRSSHRLVGCGLRLWHFLWHFAYRKNPKILDTRKFIVITLKVEQDGVSLRVMHPNDAEGIANSVDPDQTALLGAV